MSEAGVTGQCVFWNRIKRPWRTQNSGGPWSEGIPRRLGLGWRNSEDCASRRHPAALEAQDPAYDLQQFPKGICGRVLRI